MRTFHDATGREWTIAVTVAAVKRVRDLLHEDLLDTEATFTRLLVDPILLVDVVYVCCKPEADQRGVSDEQFAAAMAGDAIAGAKKALLEDLVDFFPDPRDRAAHRAALGKFDAMQGRVRNLVIERINSPALSREIEAALATFGDSFRDSPESSESTPAP